ncbi:MAG: DUF5668 domain-containing protein [candidate division Zixibacteria bacterium]
MTFGYFLICLGGLFLLQNLGIIHGGIWQFIIALLFIFLGGTMISKSVSKSDGSPESS